MKITDKMRLDFIQKNDAWISGPFRGSAFDVWGWVGSKGCSMNNDSVRRAIDDAIRSSRKRKEGR